MSFSVSDAVRRVWPRIDLCQRGAMSRLAMLRIGALLIMATLFVMPSAVPSAGAAPICSGTPLTCHLNNANGSNNVLPANCTGGYVFHLLLVQPTPGPSAFENTQVTATFNLAGGGTTTLSDDFDAQNSQNSEVFVTFIPPPNLLASHPLADATFVLPPGASYTNFNLSGDIECTGSTTLTGDTTTSTTSATPELDSIVLFAAGTIGLAGYALYQRRRRTERA